MPDAGHGAARLPGSRLLPLPSSFAWVYFVPIASSISRLHQITRSLLQKGEFIFNSARGGAGGGFEWERITGSTFLLQEHRGCSTTAAGLPGLDRLMVLWAPSTVPLGRLHSHSSTDPGIESSKGQALLHEQSRGVKSSLRTSHTWYFTR